ncbi:hypothetical protein KKA85_07545, partial [bacterium]|nr:hypothetical protein [bacterium]
TSESEITSSPRNLRWVCHRSSSLGNGGVGRTRGFSTGCYGVGYDGTNHPQNQRDKAQGRAPGDQNRDWSEDYQDLDAWDHFKDQAEFEQFLVRVFGAALPHVAEDAAWYTWHASATSDSFRKAWLEAGIRYHQTITWVKPTHVLGFAMWNYRSEPCLMGWRQGHKPPVYQVADESSNVWEVDWEGKARCTDGLHPCLHPEAHVLTEAGYRPIQTLTVGDKVYADDGTFHRVSAVTCHPYKSSDLVRIVAKGGNTPTLSSDNHPFLIWRPTRQGSKITGGEVSWLRADQLQAGDYTMTPVLAEPKLDPFPEKDEEYWFLFGLYLAQGHLQKAGHGKNRYPVFALHKKRQDLLSRIANHWESTSEYDTNDYGVISQGVTVMAFDPTSGEEFEELGGSLAHAKRITAEVLWLPRAKRLAVLRGWLNGDGCRVHNRNYWQGKTTSPDLAAHLALLGPSVGYRTNVYRYEPPEQLGTIQGRQILSQRPEYHLYFYELEQMDRRGRSTLLEHEGHQYILRYVKSVERVPYEGDVWNLSVEGSPTFQTAVGMSHNTQKPTRLFELPMLKHTRPGGICLETFAGSGSQLIAAERLGRRCFAVELNPRFCDVIVQRWEQFTGQTAVRVTGEAG